MKSSYGAYITVFVLVIASILGLHYSKFEIAQSLKKEPTDSSPLGNQLVAYFYHVGAKADPDIYKNNVVKSGLVVSPILTNLYDNLDWNLDIKRVDFQSTPGTSWLELDREGAPKQKFLSFWQNLRPLIWQMYMRYIPAIKIEQPVIHFRCSDIPFNKVGEYHIPKAETVAWAANNIRNLGFDQAILLCCNKHRKLDEAYSCQQFAEYYVQIFNNHGINTKIQCGNMVDDFAKMIHSPLLVSLNASSFSFIAGVARDPQTYISANMGVERKGKYYYQTSADWILDNRAPLLHVDVKDYNDPATVIKQLH